MNCKAMNNNHAFIVLKDLKNCYRFQSKRLIEKELITNVLEKVILSFALLTSNPNVPS